MVLTYNYDNSRPGKGKHDYFGEKVKLISNWILHSSLAHYEKEQGCD